jgi:acyl carrier protein
VRSREVTFDEPSFYELVAFVAARLDLDLDRDLDGAVVTDATTFDELGLDSLQRAELWVASEALGLDLPDALFATLTTMGDLHHYVVTKGARLPARARSDDGPGPSR